MFGEVCPWKYANPKRKWIIFQPSIFRCELASFREGSPSPKETFSLKFRCHVYQKSKAMRWREKHLRTNLPTKNLRVAPIFMVSQIEIEDENARKIAGAWSICEELGQNLAEVENSLSQGVVWRTSCRKSRVCLKKKISRVSSNVGWSPAQDSRIRKISTLSTQTSAPKFLDLDTKTMFRNVQKESPFPNPHLWDQIFRVYCQK